MENTIELRRTLMKYANAYYNLDAPLVSDEVYDKLEQEYFDITGERFEYFGHPSKAFMQVPHETPIKSLDKINDIDDLELMIRKFKFVVVEPKYDGLTLVVYPSGIIATRGGGEMGENVTHTASKIIDTSVEIPFPIRGEAIISKENFEIVNQERKEEGKEPYKNRRNAVAGMIRNKLAEDMSELVDFIAYEAVGERMSHSDQLDAINNLGFDIPPTYLFDKDGLSEAVEFCVNFDREASEYDLDGLVIKSDLYDAKSLFGFTSHHFKDAVAYKFPAKGDWTTIKSIEWTVGRTGKIVPVANLKPLELLDTTVSRVSLHNASLVDNKELHPGAEVFVVKANDVIPHVLLSRNTRRDKVDLPTTCPACQSTIRIKKSRDNLGVYQFYCPNVDCSGRQLESLIHLAKKEALNIEGLSEGTAIKLLNHPRVNTIYDIFDLDIEDILELDGFAEKSATKLFDNIQGARTPSMANFIVAANVPLIGKSAAKDIAEVIDNYDDLLYSILLLSGPLQEIPGLGEAMITSLRKGIDKFRKLNQVVTPIKVEQPMVKKQVEKQLNFVITGSFEDENGVKIHRDKIAERIEEFGHKVSGSVSKKTDYVVAGTKAGSKLTKAMDLNIFIFYKLEDLWNLLENGED